MLRPERTGRASWWIDLRRALCLLADQHSFGHFKVHPCTAITVPIVSVANKNQTRHSTKRFFQVTDNSARVHLADSDWDTVTHTYSLSSPRMDGAPPGMRCDDSEGKVGPQHCATVIRKCDRDTSAALELSKGVTRVFNIGRVIELAQNKTIRATLTNVFFCFLSFFARWQFATWFALLLYFCISILWFWIALAANSPKLN